MQRPYDTCLHCGRPRRRVVRSQKRAHAYRKRYGIPQAPAVLVIKCSSETGKHSFVKEATA